MGDVRHFTVQTNGIEMHIAEQGEGRPVVLCHGFPELWYSWRHQMAALAAAGYRAIAPDQRGYGLTSRPSEVEAYEIPTLAADLVGLLDALSEERAVFVGHDWGAVVCWALALIAPERVEAVVGMSIPFLPRFPVRPTDAFRAYAGGDFFYILYFQEAGPADEELARDPRRTLEMCLWSWSGDAPPDARRRLPPEGTGLLDTLSEPPALPPWLSEEDLDHYAAEFARTGFTAALNWYRSIDRSWERTEHLAGRRVTMPSMFVAGDRDTSLAFLPAAGMEEWLLDFRGSFVLPGCGHWTQQERPAEVNEALLGFLASLPPR